MLESKKMHAYFDIEISPCSDNEDNEILMQKKEQVEQSLASKARKPKVNRGKKNEVYIKGNHIIHAKMKNLDLASIFDELIKIMNEYKRNIKFYEGKGTPLSVLQVIDFLNEQIVLGKTEIDSKKKKSSSKELNQIKKIVAQAHKDFEEEIQQTKSVIDFTKLEELSDEIEIDDESIEAKSQTHKKMPAQAPIDTRKFVEDEVVDFSKRLTLSKEERRKFWLLNTKLQKPGPIEAKITTGKPEKTRQTAIARQKRVAEQEVSELDSFNVSPDFLNVFIKEVYSRRSSLNAETMTEDLKKLNYALDKIEDPYFKVELLMLTIYLQIELAREVTIPTLEMIDSCMLNLNNLLQILKQESVIVRNYTRDEVKNYQPSELVRQINNFVHHLGEEIEFAVKMTNPFDEQLPAILSQETEFIDFLFNYQQFLSSFDESISGQIILEVFCKITQIIHHISDDFVLNCENLSQVFESETISETVRKFTLEIIKKSKQDKIIVMAKLYHAFNIAINLQNIDEAHQLLVESQKLSCNISNDKLLTALFNRALAQMGIASFKSHNLEKSKFYLFELLNAEDTPSLLFQYSLDKDDVISLPDPMSMFPYHMHINLEEMKAAFLISSILTETAKTVNYQDNLSFCGANKFFLRFIESHHSSMFVNSMTNIFDRIFSFYRQIIQYDYQSAIAQLDNIKYFASSENFIESITRAVKLECLNCYLEKVKNDSRSTFDIVDFSNLFSIDKTELIKILSEKISSGDIQAKFDQQNKTIYINNALRSILKGEKEYDILESLKSFSQLNEKIHGGKENLENKKNSKTHEISNFIAKRFDAQEKFFNFTYDFAFFKRQSG